MCKLREILYSRVAERGGNWLLNAREESLDMCHIIHFSQKKKELYILHNYLLSKKKSPTSMQKNRSKFVGRWEFRVLTNCIYTNGQRLPRERERERRPESWSGSKPSGSLGFAQTRRQAASELVVAKINVSLMARVIFHYARAREPVELLSLACCCCCGFCSVISLPGEMR